MKFSFFGNMALRGFCLAAGLFMISAVAVDAQTTIGGHIGFELPLLTREPGETKNLADFFSVGFPLGITIKGQGRMAFDMELLPSVDNKPRQVHLEIHPGLVWDLGRHYAAGVRMAFDAGRTAYGFTPLITKSFPFKNEERFFKEYFVEANVPVRFSKQADEPATTAIAFAVHLGLAF